MEHLYKYIEAIAHGNSYELFTFDYFVKVFRICFFGRCEKTEAAEQIVSGAIGLTDNEHTKSIATKPLYVKGCNYYHPNNAAKQTYYVDLEFNLQGYETKLLYLFPYVQTFLYCTIFITYKR